MTDTKHISLTKLSQKLGLPLVWLRTEAQAGRIPALQVGDRLMFNLGAVEQELLERSSRRAEAICD